MSHRPSFVSRYFEILNQSDANQTHAGESGLVASPLIYFALFEILNETHAGESGLVASPVYPISTCLQVPVCLNPKPPLFLADLQNTNEDDFIDLTFCKIKSMPPQFHEILRIYTHMSPYKSLHMHESHFCLAGGNMQAQMLGESR